MTDTSHTESETLGAHNNKDDSAPNYEALAREMGWRPEGEYRGDPDHFVDAKTFYERGRTVLPIVQAEARALRQEIERVKADANKALEISERSREREVADLKAQLEAAKVERKEAIKEADGDRFEAADGAVKELEKAIEGSSKPPQDNTPKIDPRYQAWLDSPANQWFKGDEEAQAMAEGLVRLPKYAHLYKQAEKLWDAVAADVKKIKDSAKANARADLDRPGPEGGGRGNGKVRSQAGERSYENLTPEFKKQCDRQYDSFYGSSGTVTKEKWRERYVSGISEDAFRK